jgi:hypothetical protein
MKTNPWHLSTSSLQSLNLGLVWIYLNDGATLEGANDSLDRRTGSK